MIPADTHGRPHWLLPAPLPFCIGAALVIVAVLVGTFLGACRVYYPAEAAGSQAYEPGHAPRDERVGQEGGTEIHPEDARDWTVEIIAGALGLLGLGGFGVWRTRGGSRS